MKKLIFTYLLVLVSAVDLYPQCIPSSGWSRNLTNPTYTWYWDENVDDVKITRTTDGVLLTAEETRSVVQAAIEYAITQWTNAANAQGQRITITEGGSSADIMVQLTAGLPDNFWGDTEVNNLIIFVNANKVWTDDISLVPQYADIYTILVHEMGHIFLRSGHASYSPSVMVYSSLVVKRSLSSCDQQITLNFYNPNYTVTVKNSFGGGNGSDVKVDGVRYYSIPADGQPFTWRASTFPHSLEAIDGQSYGGYVRRYQYWTSSQGLQDATNPLSVQIPSSSSVTYEANFLKEFNVTFQNNFVGIGNPGNDVIKVNGSQYNSPTSSFQVREGNSITGEALFQIISNIEYSFDHWTGGYTTPQKTFTPTDDTTYTAYFIGKPTHVTIVSGTSGQVGTNICFVWDEHPNTNVDKYRVYRKVKHNGQWQGPTLLATLNRGTTTFTDYDYVYTSGYTDDLLNYDIRAHYSMEDTEANPYWVTTYGEVYRQLVRRDPDASNPTEYVLANHPNPFNPATTIYYQLIDDAHVALEIYDILGRLTIWLVDENREPGYHSIEWKGTNEQGQVVSSGIYLARLVAKPMHGGEVRVLTQRMLYMK